MYFSNHIPLLIMKSVNDDVDVWLSKTEEYVKLSKKTNSKHIALYFDDNILNWIFRDVSIKLEVDWVVKQKIISDYNYLNWKKKIKIKGMLSSF